MKRVPMVCVKCGRKGDTAVEFLDFVKVLKTVCPSCPNTPCPDCGSIVCRGIGHVCDADAKLPPP